MAERTHWWTERWLELCFLEWLRWLQWSPHHNCWMYLSMYLSIYLSICKLENEAVLRDCLSFWTWQHQKRCKSAPWPPNISDEHVSCTAPATRNPSLQILFICPTRAIVFGHTTKPTCLQGAESPAPATQRRFNIQHPKVGRSCGVCSILTSKRASRHNSVHFFDIWTSKSAPNFDTFDFEMCFAPQRRALFRHVNC